MNQPPLSLKSTTEIIIEVARDLGRPVTKDDVLPHVDLTEGSLDNKLSRMAREGDLVRLTRGVYDLPENVQEEERQVNETEVDYEVEPGSEVDARELRRWGLSRIEHMSIEVSAGDGSEPALEQVTGATILPNWYVREHFGVQPDRVKRVKVVGNSMEPVLKRGQHVYIILLRGDEAISNGVIYVLRGPEGLMIKRIYTGVDIVEDEEGNEAVKRYVRIWSENEEAGRDRVPLEVFERDYQLIAYLAKAEVDL